MLEDLPVYYAMKMIDNAGYPTPAANFFFDNTFQALNKFNDGLQTPIKTTAEITQLEPSVPDGTIWFNSSISKLQVKTAPGVIETITSV